MSDWTPFGDIQFKTKTGEPTGSISVEVDEAKHVRIVVRGMGNPATAVTLTAGQAHLLREILEGVPR